jgi:hypothetical protein
MYNLQFENAHQLLSRYEKQHPADPMGPVSDAAACLFSEFQRLHILQSEFFTDDKKALNSKQNPDPAVKAKFDLDLRKAETLARLQMNISSERANAMLAEILRLGLESDYLALIEKRNLAAFSEVKRERELADRLLTECPHEYDAYIAVGVESYLLSQKPAPLRWALRLAGGQTDKQNGLAKLRLTAEHGQYLLPYARLLLAIAALRDRDRAKASELLSWLATRYPQNALYRQELAKLQ